MHTIAITTCTPHGHHLASAADAALGNEHDALHRAYALAAAITIDLHAQDPNTAHVHLIAINSAPQAVIPSRSDDNNRTDLLATLHELHHRHA